MKKSYSTKAYYNYARKLLEGDAVAGDENYEKVKSPQFNALVVGASVAGVGGLGALAYLKRQFFIDNWNSLGEFFKNAGTEAGAEGFLGTAYAGLKAAFSKAISWAAGLIQSLHDKIVGAFNTPIGTSGFTWGGVVSMALIATAICAIIYKIYKVIKMRRSATTESVTEYKAKQRKRIKKAITECNVMFSDLYLFSEAGWEQNEYMRAGATYADLFRTDVQFLTDPSKYADDPNWINSAKSDAARAKNLYIKKGSELVAQRGQTAAELGKTANALAIARANGDTGRIASLQKTFDTQQAKISDLDAQIKTNTSKLKYADNWVTRVSRSRNSFMKGSDYDVHGDKIAQAQGWAARMWETVKTWTSNHKLVVIIGVLALILGAYFGIKKYLEKKRAAATTESTMRSNRRRAYTY